MLITLILVSQLLSYYCHVKTLFNAFLFSHVSIQVMSFSWDWMSCKIHLIIWLICFLWKDLGKQHSWMQYQEDWKIRTIFLVKCMWMGITWRRNILEIASLTCHRLISTFVCVYCDSSSVKKIQTNKKGICYCNGTVYSYCSFTSSFDTKQSIHCMNELRDCE